MKALLVVLAIGFGSIGAQAAPFGWGGNGGRGNVKCTVNDNGWEEHYGGHSDCGSCLREHGSCNETCSSEETYCTAEGTTYRGSNTSSTETFRGRGNDRWDAERDAINECRRYNASGCSIKSCDTQNQIVSSRRCN